MADVVSVYRLTMDIKKPTTHVVTPVIVQYDNVRLEVTVLDDGKPFDLSNVTDIEFSHQRPDLEIIVEPGVLEDGKIVYTYVGNEMDIPGNVRTSFSMINGNEKVSVRDFYVVVQKSLKESQYIPGSPKADLLQELIMQVENLTESTQPLLEEVAVELENVREQSAYAKMQGDYVASQSEKLDSLDSLVIPVQNMISNGNFSNGRTGWDNYRTSTTVANGILTNTTTGGGNVGSLYQTTSTALTQGYKYYIEARVRVKNSEAERLTLRFLGTTVASEVVLQQQLNPVQDQWYILKGVVTVTNQTGNARIYINQHYLNDVIGRQIEVDYVTGIVLSTVFGVGNEPTQSEIDSFLSRYPKHWFGGTVNWFDARALSRIQSGNNLDDYLVEEGVAI